MGYEVYSRLEIYGLGALLFRGLEVSGLRG